MRKTLALLLALALVASNAVAAQFDYGLKAQEVAPGTYVFEGRNEDFSFDNGGNIVNTAFIVTKAGVVLIDSGPSHRYGDQVRQAIARVTDQPVVRVLITHHHPDHFLGNQAYEVGTLAALPRTIADMKAEGGAFTENMYRLNGDWMRDTEMVLPQKPVAPGVVEIGGHHLELRALKGHTDSDLTIFDRDTGVLFASDLVFHDRAPTTPHARIADWLASLDVLEAVPFRVLVPGHGPVAHDAGPIRQTRDYLRWLDRTLREAAASGLDMNEVLALPLPPVWRRMAVSEAEYGRSVSHLYPAAEEAVLTGGDSR